MILRSGRKEVENTRKPIVLPWYYTGTILLVLNNRGPHLDELAGLSSLLQGAAHLVRGEVERGVARSDVLLDRLDAGAVALLQSLYGLENHLRSDV